VAIFSVNTEYFFFILQHGGTFTVAIEYRTIKGNENKILFIPEFCIFKYKCWTSNSGLFNLGEAVSVPIGHEAQSLVKKEKIFCLKFYFPAHS
jgi:uncharacterized Fe-S cluster protein YjdI